MLAILVGKTSYHYTNLTKYVKGMWPAGCEFDVLDLAHNVYYVRKLGQ